MLFVVAIMLMFGMIFYFLIPNVVEIKIEEETISIRKGSKTVTENIGNIKELYQTFSFINQSASTWAFYKLTLTESNELGNDFCFLTKKSSFLGDGNKEAINELIQKIKSNKKTPANRVARPEPNGSG